MYLSNFSDSSIEIILVECFIFFFFSLSIFVAFPEASNGNDKAANNATNNDPDDGTTVSNGEFSKLHIGLSFEGNIEVCGFISCGTIYVSLLHNNVNLSGSEEWDLTSFSNSHSTHGVSREVSVDSIMNFSNNLSIFILSISHDKTS
jgi:hypothetical protein